MTTHLNHLTASDIAARLADALPDAHDPIDLEFPALAGLVKGPPRPAAVLAPLLRLDGEWHVLYTRRNANLPEHSGQVAFPGGRADPGDPSPEATALREAQEEIGLAPSDVRILGRLRQYLTITNYRITPVVGVMPWPYVFTPAEIEVSRIFTMPLTWLADPANHEERQRILPEPHPPVGVIYFKEYDGEVLWGATARMTLQLIKSLM
jgi:8-oxo-dGTP pyrophosphatase MutT (NUDIX family)